VGRFLDSLQLLKPVVVTNLCEVPAGRCGDIPKLTAQSFETLRTMYGDVYEAVGDFCIHFACLNNIRLRGAYERFDRWRLEEYIASDKAARIGPFQRYRTFSRIIEPHYDNQLRNASHHGKMQYDLDGDRVLYWPKRGAATRTTAKTMSLWNYANKCFDLLQALGVLLSLHHGLEVLHGASGKPSRVTARKGSRKRG
jgi:hypothetical protein